MYDINDDQVTMLAISPDGTLREIVCEAGKTRDVLCRAIGCHSVASIALRDNVHLWVNATGVAVQTEPNIFSAAVIARLSMDMTGEVAVGTVVVAGVRNNATVSLDDHTLRYIVGRVLALGGRIVPAMRSARMDGGRAWKWEYLGYQFRAEARNGSPVVTLHYRTNAPDSEWTVSHDRDIDGRSAKLVAEELLRDTTGGVR